MRAVLVKRFGPPEDLRVEDVKDPRAGDGEVLIQVHGAGINFPDILQIQGKHQFQPPFPFIPGLELAGLVTELGPGVGSFQIGDRVIALPPLGAMAEAVAVPATSVVRVPSTMDLSTAAGFAVVYGTSYYGLSQRAELRSGETLLVLGAGGGVGRAAVEIGKAMGARVIAAASTDEKLQVAAEAGADDLVNYGDGVLKDKVKELTGGAGADVIYDPVGGDLFDQATRAINWNGRLLVIGFASGRIPKYPTNLALLKGCQVIGVFWGEFTRREPDIHEQNTAELFRLHAEGQLKPLVSEVFRLEQCAQAFNRLAQREAVGKVILRVREE